MRYKKVFASALACAALIGCLGTSAGAEEVHSAVSPAVSGQEVLPLSARSALEPKSGSFQTTVRSKKVVTIGDPLYLDKGESVTFVCTYAPKSADVDFGLLDSDGVFHHVSGSDGRIDRTIRIEEWGEYTPAVRNNSAFSVSVTGHIDH